MQIRNNNHVEDFLLSDGKVVTDLSGKSVELKYFLRDETTLREFLANDSIKKQVKDLKVRSKLSKIICRFFFKDYAPSLELQKKLIFFQKQVFDEVTVHMVKDNFGDLKTLYGYALSNTKKPISTLIDLKLSPSLLIQVVEYLGTVRPANTRWVYRELKSHIYQFAIVSKFMQASGIDAYITGCRKIYGGDTEFRNIDVSTILKGFFKFKGCCLDHRPRNKGRGGFPIRVFKEENYEWVELKLKDYRASRLEDFLKMDAVNPTQEEIDSREKVKRLFKTLEALSPKRMKGYF